MNQTKATITVPDRPDKTAVTIVGDKIVFVTIQHDQDCENPCTSSDGVGFIYSASRRDHNYKSFEELQDIANTDADAVKLSYFEHGLCLWMVMGGEKSRTPGVEFQWDGVRFAGVWVPDDAVRDSYIGQDGLTRRQWMAQQAESACDQYTKWANGECYGYDIQAYKLRTHEPSGKHYKVKSDYRFEPCLAEDYCSGHIGWEWAVQATQEAIEALEL